MSQQTPPPINPDSKSTAKGFVVSLSKTAGAAAKLVGLQTERTKLTTLTLPAAYRALGNDCVQQKRHLDGVKELIEQLRTVTSELSSLAETPKADSSKQSLTDKAKAAGKQAVDFARRKQLEMKRESLCGDIGKAIYETHKESSGSKEIISPIQAALNRVAELDSEIAKLSHVGKGSWITPKRMLVGVAGILLLITFSVSFTGRSQPKEITNSIGMQLVLIPAGTFMMGSPESEKERSDEQQHQVNLTRNYYLGKHEVTQAQYERVMGDNPSYFQGRRTKSDSSNHPVEQVSREDAMRFCQKISELPEEKKSGRVYRLPTEAEWEYVCRAGSTTAYSFGDDKQTLVDYAWYGEDSGASHPVGQKKPNAWGLYDMHGNVLEWCSDWWSRDYSREVVTDPFGPIEGSDGVYRGGGSGSADRACRSAERFVGTPSLKEYFLGFRVVMNYSSMSRHESSEVNVNTTDNDNVTDNTSESPQERLEGVAVAGAERDRTKWEAASTIWGSKRVGAFKKIVSKFKQTPDKYASNKEIEKFSSELQKLIQEFSEIPFNGSYQSIDARKIIDMWENEIEGRYEGYLYSLTEDEVGSIVIQYQNRVN